MNAMTLHIVCDISRGDTVLVRIVLIDILVFTGPRCSKKIGMFQRTAKLDSKKYCIARFRLVHRFA